jgi:hypothetical protein
VLDGGSGGARSAPPAIDQGIVDNDAVQYRVGVDNDAGAVVLVRSVPMSGTTVRSGRP